MSLRDIVNSMMPPEGATKVELAGVANGNAFETFKNKTGLLEVQRYLPLAAQKYEISSDPRDYVVSPVIIFPTDIPNRNCLAASTLDNAIS